jgi:hypothetical protein
MDYFEDRSFLLRRRDYEEITSYHLSASSDGKEVDGLLGETEEYTDKRPETSWHRKY